ncbi:ABC transporter ATP-binding protein [Brevibacillus sp. SYSU BS000544]|uniref:ABC transporter ATP-binding protein n=1 Tax=Brevibacillus sp. SYSU BS000544 TaxID=3416443 RepID=UPI003CE5C6C6
MININGLKKSYLVGTKPFEVLRGIDLEVKSGDMIAIMGRSGSGKSTLLNIIAGLDKCENGTYLYNDQNVSNMNHSELANFRKKNIGFILQNYALIDSKNVFQNVALPLYYSKKSKKEIQEKVEHTLLLLGIEELMYKSIEMLSGGEMQRVAIARALIQDAELILADEPTGSLDEQTEKEILSIFKDLNKQGKTIIIVTHDQQVADICHKTYLIKEGRCLAVTMGRTSGT